MLLSPPFTFPANLRTVPLLEVFASQGSSQLGSAPSPSQRNLSESTLSRLEKSRMF